MRRVLVPFAPSLDRLEQVHCRPILTDAACNRGGLSGMKQHEPRTRDDIAHSRRRSIGESHYERISIIDLVTAPDIDVEMVRGQCVR
jgi:hypothetical protein